MAGAQGEKPAGLKEQFAASTSRFAAAKAWHATQAIRRQEADKNGVVRSPEDYSRHARKVLDTFQLWQQAEYSTAVTRARTARQWEEFNEPGRDLFPNIRWMPSRSVNLRVAHQEFYGRVWAKSDPFWLQNQPGTEWNCKCDWEETSDPVTDNAAVQPPELPAGLEGNPAETGEIFSDNASYFQISEDAKKECNRVIFKDHFAWAKENLKPVHREELTEDIRFSGKGIKEYLNQPHDDYFVKNEMIRSMDHILKEAVYKGVSEYKGKVSHIFEVTVCGKKNYLIANKYKGRGIMFYSISDSDKILLNIRKAT